jgi:hypothetical protein
VVLSPKFKKNLNSTYEIFYNSFYKKDVVHIHHMITVLYVHVVDVHDLVYI